MNIKNIFEVALAVLTALGGGSLIVFAFSSWMGKVWANRIMANETAKHAQELEALRTRLSQETESYKIKLRKSEFIFQKEFEAASELVALRRSILPAIRYPDMDWEDACQDIAENFSKIEHELDQYLAKHGAILGEHISDLIGRGSGIAGHNKFDSSTSEAKKAANELYGIMEDAEEKLLKKVLEQSIT